MAHITRHLHDLILALFCKLAPTVILRNSRAHSLNIGMGLFWGHIAQAELLSLFELAFQRQDQRKILPHAHTRIGQG